jgi:hypothetical protein
VAGRTLLGVKKFEECTSFTLPPRFMYVLLHIAMQSDSDAPPSDTHDVIQSCRWSSSLSTILNLLLVGTSAAHSLRHMLRSRPFLDDSLQESWHLPDRPCTLSGYAIARI